MSPRARMEYLETIYLRYKKASGKRKTLILNEFCLNCGYHRKHAIRLLNHFKRFAKPKPRKRGKPSKWISYQVYTIQVYTIHCRVPVR